MLTNITATCSKKLKDYILIREEAAKNLKQVRLRVEPVSLQLADVTVLLQITAGLRKLDGYLLLHQEEQTEHDTVLIATLIRRRKHLEEVLLHVHSSSNDILSACKTLRDSIKETQDVAIALPTEDIKSELIVFLHSSLPALAMLWLRILP